VKVDPDKTAELKVAEFRPESAQYVISNLTSDQITMFVDEKAITPALEKSFRTILAKKSDIAAVDGSTLMRRQEINRINGEQNRLRENMKALRGSTEEKALLQRYVQQLNAQEDRLVVLNREITKLEELRATLTEQLDQMVQKIVIDEKLDHGVEARASN
jgi:predicted  nucleic acid-binding Zn-ribbon protein